AAGGTGRSCGGVTRVGVAGVQTGSPKVDATPEKPCASAGEAPNSVATPAAPATTTSPRKAPPAIALAPIRRARRLATWCPGCGAARSGASLIRDRHRLERSRVCSAPFASLMLRCAGDTCEEGSRSTSAGTTRSICEPFRLALILLVLMFGPSPTRPSRPVQSLRSILPGTRLDGLPKPERDLHAKGTSRRFRLCVAGLPLPLA